jgi:hypothetical protein
MSDRNGKLTRRAGLALGSACFLATAVLSSSRADASATLVLTPNLQSGQTDSQNPDGSWNLTVPAGAATISYDVVVNISGTGPQVSRIQGAVETATTGSATVMHNTYSVGSTYNELDTVSGTTFTNAASGGPGVFSLTTASKTGQAFGTLYTFKPGLIQASSSGVGPSGAFSSLINTGDASTSNGRVQVTYATPKATASLDALSTSAAVTGAAGDTATISWADGTGSTASGGGSGTVYQSALEWTENGSSFFSGTGAAIGNYTQLGLNVIFSSVTTGPFIGDIPGDLNGDGIVDISDFSVLAAHYGQTDAGGAAS